MSGFFQFLSEHKDVFVVSTLPGQLIIEARDVDGRIKKIPPIQQDPVCLSVYLSPEAMVTNLDLYTFYKSGALRFMTEEEASHWTPEAAPTPVATKSVEPATEYQGDHIDVALDQQAIHRAQTWIDSNNSFWGNLSARVDQQEKAEKLQSIQSVIELTRELRDAAASAEKSLIRMQELSARLA